MSDVNGVHVSGGVTELSRAVLGYVAALEVNSVVSRSHLTLRAHHETFGREVFQAALAAHWKRVRALESLAEDLKCQVLLEDGAWADVTYGGGNVYTFRTFEEWIGHSFYSDLVELGEARVVSCKGGSL